MVSKSVITSKNEDKDEEKSQNKEGETPATEVEEALIKKEQPGLNPRFQYRSLPKVNRAKSFDETVRSPSADVDTVQSVSSALLERSSKHEDRMEGVQRAWKGALVKVLVNKGFS